MPPLVAVAAVAENGVIGRDNHLPWRLKTDLRRFKALTLGRPMIMGRRNWDSIGRPLPGRESIVLTRDPAFRAEGAQVVHGWSEARERATEIARTMGAPEIVICGGGEIYAMAMPETDRIHLTVVHARPDGDVRFPAIDPAFFRAVSREEHPAGPQDEYAFAFVEYRRV